MTEPVDSSSPAAPSRPSDDLGRLDPLEGAHVGGRYKLQRRVYSSALGRCYVARDLERGATVRIEVFHAHLTGAPSFADALTDTIVAYGSISCPSALPPIDCGLERLEGEWIAYQVTRPFRGRPLDAAIRSEGLPTVASAVHIALALLEALEEAHGRGLVHGAVSPRVVLVDPADDGEVNAKLTGFGAARLAVRARPHVQFGPTMGDGPYLAPELAQDGSPPASVDLYSTGCVLYELLAASPPFVSMSPAELRRWHVSKAPEPPARRAPDRDIGAALDRTVLQALAKDPAARFQSAAAMHEALGRALAVDQDRGGGGIDEATTWMPDAPPAIGREAAVERICELARAPLETSRGGHAVLLLGPAGAGKTAIAERVGHELALGPIRVIRVEGQSTSTTPHGPFIEMFRDALDLGRAAAGPSLEAAGTALSALGLDALDVRLLLDLLVGAADGPPLGPALAHREKQVALRSALRHLLDSAPSLLVIEDADALDPATRKLAGELMASAARRRFGVLLTARYDPWPEWQPKHCVRLEIGPLAEEAAFDLVRDEIGEGPIDEEALRSLTQPARGSPWLLTLRARAALASGALSLDESGNSWRSNVSDLPATPVGLSKMILDAAPMEVRRWICGAALAGRRAPIALLDAWTPAAGPADDLAARCADTGLVSHAMSSLIFASAGARAAVLDLVSQKVRTPIHARFVEWLTSGDPPRGEDHVIAEHLLASGDLRGAAHRFEAAGRSALGREDAQAATMLLSSARAAWAAVPDPSSAARTALELAEAYLCASDTRAAHGAIDDATKRLKELPVQSENPKSGRDLAILQAARLRVSALLARDAGNPEKALELLEDAIGLAAPTGNSREWYDVERALVSVLLSLDRPDEAREHAMIAVEVGRALEKEVLQAPRGAGGISSSHDGRRSSRRGTVADALSQLGRVELGRGAMDAAVAAFEGAIEESSATGDEASGARAMANLAHVLAEGGDWEAARERATAAMALATRIGDRSAAARIAISLGTYRLRLGDVEGAAEAYQQARAFASASGWAEGVRLAKEAATKALRG